MCKLTIGGERRRVSLAEVLAVNASIYCWDNATRGLDASTALEFARVCRKESDEAGKINVVSLYQAGNSIFNLFDKLMVIADGQVIYYGLRTDARQYFEALGFEHMQGANTADYLTSVTSMVERRVKPGFEHCAPGSAAQFAAIYAGSDVRRRMDAELAAHTLKRDQVTRDTQEAFAAVQRAKSRGAPQSWPSISPFASQVKAALLREYQQRWGDQL